MTRAGDDVISNLLVALQRELGLRRLNGSMLIHPYSLKMVNPIVDEYKDNNYVIKFYHYMNTSRLWATTASAYPALAVIVIDRRTKATYIGNVIYHGNNHRTRRMDSGLGPDNFLAITHFIENYTRTRCY